MSLKHIDRDTCKDVLSRYARAIVHMRQQILESRFGLVFGAGASIAFGFPDWKTLVERIAKHPSVRGTNLIARGSGNTSISQMLYQHYRAAQLAKAGADDQVYNRVESKVQVGWQKVVHSALYRKVPKSIKSIMKRDPYLWAFLNVVKDTRLTINYNFDDTIQRMLDATRSPDDRRKKRGHSTVWNANIQMFPRNGVIYHPNGFLPHVLRERPSEHLVFLEDSFADQLIESMAGHYTALAYHLAQATRLLIGLSLNDATLKHLLRQCAHSHPGHYHYFVAYQRDDAKRDTQFEQTVFDANFEVYNLVTLFLKNDEIAALGHLLDLPDDEFRHLAEEAGQDITYKFLLTGSVAVGKSTTVSQFRCLRTYDEWLEERAPGMERDPSKVDSSTIRRIDDWVANQLNLKNLAMHDAQPGIHIVDRAPLDAFAFTPADGWKQKAKLIKEAVSPGDSRRDLVPAHVILMIGDPEVMAVRALSKHKVTDGPALEQQQKLLKKVYYGRPGVSVVDTRDKSIKQVVKEVARIVFSKRYEEAPIHSWLDDIQRGRIHA